MQHYFVSDRRVPERSHGCSFSWIMRPLDDASLGRSVPWSTHHFDDAPIRRSVLDRCVQTHWDRMTLCWDRFGRTVEAKLGVILCRHFIQGMCSAVVQGTCHPRDASSMVCVVQGTRRPRHTLSFQVRTIRAFSFVDTSSKGLYAECTVPIVV